MSSLRLLPMGVCLVVLWGCGERHVQLKFPDTTRGAEYVCQTTDASAVNCQPSTNLDPAEQNKAGTVFVILPRECKNSFSEITIHDSGASNPTVNVRCSPLEAPIQ
jgi:hypothetical protein